MTEIEKKTGMTDAECEYWDDYITNTENPVHLGPDLSKLGIKPGFAHNYLPFINELDNDVVEYLRKQSTAFHKSQIQIINDLVHEKLAVGAW
jgi:hypothetical protein